MEFYKTLLEIMEEKSLKIPDVARLTGLSDSTVRSIISRKTKNVTLEVAFKMSKGLDVSLERLNGEELLSKEKISEVINPIFKLIKENKEIKQFFNRISSYNEESLKNFIEYLRSTFSEEINSLDDNFTALDVFKLYEYVNKIISFELNKLSTENKNEIKNPNNNNLITATKEDFLEDKYTTLAAHDDDLTKDEKQNVNSKIMEALKKKQK